MNEIPLFKVFMSDKIGPLMEKTLLSGFIGQGKRVEEFEEKLRNKFGINYLFTVNSATSGIHLAIHLLKSPFNIDLNGLGYASKWNGIEDGSEILTTPLTCMATNLPILANNLNIKWVDIDPATLNMDLDDLSRKITRKTRAIIAVHWGGYPLDIDRLKKIQEDAEKIFGFKPAVIEDCAHAFGSAFNDRLVGTHGNISIFSFQAIKHLTSADGGCVILPHEEIYKKGKLLRWYGIDREGPRIDFRCEQDIRDYGFKFHMNDVNATIGIENLNYVDTVVQRHKDNSAYYDAHLKNVPGVTLLSRDKRMDSASWIYSMLVENKSDFMRHMKQKGIHVSQVHERNDKHTCFSKFRTFLPSLDRTIPKLICIPVGWWVTEGERQYIVDAVKAGW